MMKRRHTILVMLFVAVLAGCTTMKEVKPKDRPLADYLDIGDHIVVYEKSGKIGDMRCVLIEDDVLRGSYFDDGLEPVEIRLDQIEKVEAERIAVGRSAAVVLGGILLAPIAAVGAGLALVVQ